MPWENNMASRMPNVAPEPRTTLPSVPTAIAVVIISALMTIKRSDVFRNQSLRTLKALVAYQVKSIEQTSET